LREICYVVLVNGFLGLKREICDLENFWTKFKFVKNDFKQTPSFWGIILRF
jgi:hypothetical protein